MRYTHSINAVKCQEWDINLNQGALMDLLNQAASWAEPRMINGKIYYWVSRNKIIKEIPVAYAKPDTVYRALKILADKDLISHLKDGKRDMVNLTEKGKTWNVKGTVIGDAILGNKSEFDDNSDKNPCELGNKSENNSDKNPTYKNTSNNPNTNDKKVYKPEKPDGVSEQVWSDLLAVRKSKNAIDSQTAWSRIDKAIKKAQQATGHSLEDIYSYWVMRAWAGFEHQWYIDSHKTQQQTNNQGNRNEVNQSANSKPKQSAADIYQDSLANELQQRYGQQTEPTANDQHSFNVYDMEKTV